MRNRFGVELPIIQSPVMRIEDNIFELRRGMFEALIFTSENAVNAAAAQEHLRGLPAYCVGAQTAKTAAEAGFDTRTGRGNAEDLIGFIQASDPRGLLLHVRGEHTRGDVTQGLERVGVRAREVIAYRQIPVAMNEAAKDALMGENLVILPLFSPRSAELFLKEAVEIRAPLSIVAMSEAVETVVSGSIKAQIVVAKRPDADSIVEAMAGLLDAV
ncbi:uroporphyrinogen-III synthase [Cochlodiniinecator piscidefendens]|uniref:uroporphyrinogen-III synthase n=1 Tax=Cochlodiniinecator piscidefendens TaxID=2715756 RepID=UPI00197BFE67|nr:uroporphyrinogen-III synthase [Cochlodiniinecator piscidefendens]